MPSATVTASKRERARADPEDQRPERAAPEIGDDHRRGGRADRTSGAGAPPTRRPGGAPPGSPARRPPTSRGTAARPRRRRRTARPPASARRAATGLRSSPTGTRRTPRRAGPAHGGARQVAEAGAEVGEGERRARRHAREGAGEPVPHGRGAAEPAVGPGDVPERLGDRGRIGGRIVEQLDADRARGERRHGDHEKAA